MKITKQRLKQIIREEYQSLYEDEDDDEERAIELAAEYTPTDDEERAAYEERTVDIPRSPSLPMGHPLIDMQGGPKGISDQLYRIKKLIDDLPISTMEKLKYLNDILRGVEPGDGL